MVLVKIVKYYRIDIDRAIELANRSWDEIRSELEKAVGSTVEADAVIEKAKTKASAIVEEKLGRDAPELSEKVAKYVVAFMLVERAASG